VLTIRGLCQPLFFRKLGGAEYIKRDSKSVTDLLIGRIYVAPFDQQTAHIIQFYAFCCICDVFELYRRIGVVNESVIMHYAVSELPQDANFAPLRNSGINEFRQECL